MKILIVSDIHGNYPALQAVDSFFARESFDMILNAGDCTVYAPFANEVLNWLEEKKSVSIIGNTDKKVRKLLKGKNFKKPGKAEKRVMYEHAATTLQNKPKKYLLSLKKKAIVEAANYNIGIFHGSPDDPEEFLFPTASLARFRELADKYNHDMVITGHTHTPYHLRVNGTDFINPGSVGRMFDGDYRASCAVLELNNKKVSCQHYRIDWDLDRMVEKIKEEKLPSIYCKMYKKGLKLN